MSDRDTVDKDNNSGKEVRCACSKSEEDLTREEDMLKQVSYYETLVSAWVLSRLEKDKQIVTLSAVAIGWLTTFRSALTDVWSFLIWLFANLFFIGSIIVVLIVFTRNSDHIQIIIEQDGNYDERKSRHENGLRRLTSCAFTFFVIGVILGASLALYQSGYTIHIEKGVPDVR